VLESTLRALQDAPLDGTPDPGILLRVSLHVIAGRSTFEFNLVRSRWCSILQPDQYQALWQLP
jgi:hypothetical protein